MVLYRNAAKNIIMILNTNKMMIVKNIKMVNNNTYELICTVPNGIIYKPGQFITFIVDNDGQKLRKSYSIGNYPNNNTLEFLIKPQPNGVMEKKLPLIKAGDLIEFAGPFGNFCRTELEPVFIVGGGGISGVFAIIEDYINNTSMNVDLLYSFRFDQDYLYREKIESIKDRLKLRIFKTSITKRISIEDIKQIKDYQNKVYYICGPRDMIKLLREELEKIVPKNNIKFEMW